MEKEMKLTNDIRMEAEALAYEKLERITEYTKKIVQGELQLF
jgi:S-adenosylmethionine synthetase